MLSVGIKNSILVILIILIIHFIIKNMILERPSNKGVDTELKNAKAGYHPPYSPEKFTNIAEVNQDACKNKPRDDDAELKKFQEDELMRFVAMGDSSESKTLDSFFKDNIVSSDVKDKQSCTEMNVCKFKADNQQLPLSTTCDTNIQNLPLTNNNMKIHANCDLNQDKNIMILTEYENEKDMNGGKIYGVLDAFDNYDLNYQQYDAACDV